MNNFDFTPKRNTVSINRETKNCLRTLGLREGHILPNSPLLKNWNSSVLEYIRFEYTDIKGPFQIGNTKVLFLHRPHPYNPSGDEAHIGLLVDEFFYSNVYIKALQAKNNKGYIKMNLLQYHISFRSNSEPSYWYTMMWEPDILGMIQRTAFCCWNNFQLLKIVNKHFHKFDCFIERRYNIHIFDEKAHIELHLKDL